MLEWQKTGTDEHAAREAVKEALAHVKVSITASADLNAKMTERDKLPKVSRAMMVSLD